MRGKWTIKLSTFGVCTTYCGRKDRREKPRTIGQIESSFAIYGSHKKICDYVEHFAQTQCFYLKDGYTCCIK